MATLTSITREVKSIAAYLDKSQHRQRTGGLFDAELAHRWLKAEMRKVAEEMEAQGRKPFPDHVLRQHSQQLAQAARALLTARDAVNQLTHEALFRA